MGPLPLRACLLPAVLLGACVDAAAPGDSVQARMAAALEGVALDCDDPVPRYYDVDGDGHGDPAMEVELCAEVEGFVDDATDCDGLRPDVSPSADEICGDGLDNDCSGGDQTCAPPELATDAYTLTSDTTTGAFGPVIATGLDLDGDGVQEVALADPDLDDDRGSVWILELPEPVPAGTSEPLSSRVQSELTGDLTDLRLGQGLAAGWWDDPSGLRTTVAFSCRGPVDEGSTSRQTAVFLLQSELGEGGDRSEVDAALLGPVADPAQNYTGIESLAMGRWVDGTHDQGVLAAAYLGQSRVYVVGMDAVTGDVDLASVGVPIATTDLGIDLGTGLHWADVDGDGLDDLFIGAPNWDSDPGTTEDGGAVWIVPGDELDTLSAGGPESLLDDVGVRIWYPAADLGLGQRIASADLDQDGELEVVLGSFEENPPGPGRVYLVDPGGMRGLSPGDAMDVVSPSGGVRAVAVEGTEQYDFFGFSVAALDGLQPRVAVGTPGWDGTGDESTLRGGLWLFDSDNDLFDTSAETVDNLGATFVASDSSTDPVGTGLASAGDIDEDGQDELWVSALGLFEPGRASLLLRTGAR